MSFLGFGDAVWAQIGNPVEIATGATVCALCGARALLVQRERAAWAVLAVALAMYVAGARCGRSGSRSYSLRPSRRSPTRCGSRSIPGATWPWGCCCAGACAASRCVWLDGLLASFVVAAVGIALIHGVIAAGLEGTSAAAVTTNLAYPLGDVLLVGFVVGAFALSGWRPGREWLLLGAGFTAEQFGVGAGDHQVTRWQ